MRSDIKMRVNFTFCLTLFFILLHQFTPNEGQNSPQLPVSVLDELMRPNNTGGTNDPLNMILGSLGSIMGPDNTMNPGINGNPDNSTGVGALDFFRNLIAMFLRAALQVFKFFQLLSRSITGNGGKKLTFLSTDELPTQVSDSDNSNERLERVIRQIQTSAEEFPLNFFISDEKAQQLEDQIKDVFKILPNFETKSMGDILKSDAFIANFKSGLKSINRHKRQDINQFDDNYKAFNLPLNTLLSEFIESHSQLNNDFHFEFPQKEE